MFVDARWPVAPIAHDSAPILRVMMATLDDPGCAALWPLERFRAIAIRRLDSTVSAAAISAR